MKSQRAFTLIELLVVIAIIGFIASIVLVNLQGVRGRGRIAAGKQFSSSLQHTLGAYAVGIWRFEDGSGTTALDSSGYINNGTLNGGAIWRTEAECGLELGGCLEFDGVDDEMETADDSSIQNIFDNGETISAWINPRSDGQNNYGRIIDKESPGGWTFFVGGESSGQVKVSFRHAFGGGTNGQWDSTNTVVDINKWNHIAVTYDNGATGNDPTMYINGTSVNLNENSTPVGTRVSDVGGTFRIGNGLATNRAFDGSIDDVYIFSTSLTTAQVQKLYAEGLSKHQLVQQ